MGLYGSGVTSSFPLICCSFCTCCHLSAGRCICLDGLPPLGRHIGSVDPHVSTDQHNCLSLPSEGVLNSFSSAPVCYPVFLSSLSLCAVVFFSLRLPISFTSRPYSQTSPIWLDSKASCSHDINVNNKLSTPVLTFGGLMSEWDVPFLVIVVKITAARHHAEPLYMRVVTRRYEDSQGLPRSLVSECSSEVASR